MAVKSCADNRAQKKVNLFSTGMGIGMPVENETGMRKWLSPLNSFSCKWKLLPLVGLEARDKKESSKS